MKKFFIGAVFLLFLFGLKSYLAKPPEKKDPVDGAIETDFEPNRPPPSTHHTPPPAKPPILPSALAQNELNTPPPDSEKNKMSQESAPLNQQENSGSTKKTPEQLAEEKLKVPIIEELKKASPFTTWNPSELRFTGNYQGQVHIKGQTYLIRMNLMFDGTNYNITPSTCVAMFGPRKAVFQENYGDGNIHLIRTEDDKYIILSVSDRFYFQIFQTMSGNRKSFRTHITVPEEKTPFVFKLNEMSQPGTLKACQDIHPT